MRRAGQTAVNLVLLGIGLLFLVPMLWVLLASVDADATLRVKVPELTGGNFAAVMDFETTWQPLLNGLVLCGGAALLAIVCGALAAYPLSRYESRYRRPFLLTILFATGLPITAIMVPVYGMFVQLNLDDTLYGTILFLAATALPFAIWLLKNFLDGVPRELEEAAWIDGASGPQSFLRVLLPLMWPGVMAVTVFTFLSMWGNFFVPFVLLSSPDTFPPALSIFTFFGQHGEVAYGRLAAFSLIYTAPVILLYLLMSRRISGAFTMGGAVKG